MVDAPRAVAATRGPDADGRKAPVDPREGMPARPLPPARTLESSTLSSADRRTYLTPTGQIVPRPAASPPIASLIDKSKLLLGEPRRVRNIEHLRFVASRPCLVCGRQPCDAHHLRFTQPAALGKKVSDEFTLPLCRFHHDEVHRAAAELKWWQARNIEPLAMARDLWARSRSTNALPKGDNLDGDTRENPRGSAEDRPQNCSG